MWDAYHCFTAYHLVSQNEPTDTYIHTFEIIDWQLQEKRWWTLLGRISAIDSPSTSPIFSYTHPGGPQRYIILRPDSPGLLCHVSKGIPFPCPDHWKDVNDIIPDENTSYIYMLTPGTSIYEKDYYNISYTPFATIERLTITARLKRIGGPAYVRVARINMYSNGIESIGPALQLPPWWVNLSRTWTSNPFTGLPWTTADIFYLQIGVGLRMYWGSGWQAVGACTQIFATIQSGTCTPELIPGPYP